MSIGDQFTYITKAIVEDSFQNNQYTFSTWIGLEKEFDKVGKAGL